MKAKRKKEASPNDVVELILRDHKPLKKLIKILKNAEGTFAKKRPAFAEFAELLMAHAKPEEQSLYVHMKEGTELRSEGFEGDTEHAIADQLVEEIKELTNDRDEWMAKVKVLAELVEHHIEEEEEDMLPDVRKEFGAEERAQIGKEYLRLRAGFTAEERAA